MVISDRSSLGKVKNIHNFLRYSRYKLPFFEFVSKIPVNNVKKSYFPYLDGFSFDYSTVSCRGTQLGCYKAIPQLKK